MPLYSTVPVLAVKLPPVVPRLKNAPPTFNNPVDENTMAALAPLLSVVISPDTITVPVEIVNWCLVLVPPSRKDMLLAIKFPAPTARVLVELDGLRIVTVPETVRVIPELILTTEFEVAVERKVRDKQFAVASTVTVIPLLIVTASDEVGTADPPHVAVLFQFPVTLAVRCAFVVRITKITNNKPNPIFLQPRIFTAHFKESFGELIFPEVAMLLNVLILKYFESDDCRSVREVFDNCN